MNFHPRRRQKPAFDGRDFDALYAAGDARRLAPTRAEAELERILNELGGGALRGEFKREWPCAGGFVDFYFPAMRLAIEVDGGYHRAQTQWRADQLKTRALEAEGITVLRLTNAQVTGGREALVALLRAAWKQASARLREANTAREPLAVYDLTLH